MKRSHSLKRYTTIILCASLVAIGACTPTKTQRGNFLKAYQIEEVATGVHTRTEVLRLLGSPTTKATFNENVWYYIGQETEKRGILDPEVTQNVIYTVVFNEEGKVDYIGQIEDDMVDVPYSNEKTPTHGNDITVIQQLLGNLGRFNPQTNP